MPSIRSLVSKYFTYYFKLVAVILSLSKIMPTCFCYIEKGLVYTIIAALSSRQLSLYTKYIKLNIHSSCNVQSVFNTKYIFFIYLYNF